MTIKYRVIERFRGKYSISDMCNFFEVSRSGYYDWRNRQHREDKDQWLIDMVVECQSACMQTYGIRRVKRWIQRNKGKTVNLNAILRIMRKLDLLAQIRRRKPYSHYKRAAHKYNNILQRRFDQKHANKFWATDITYIPTKSGMVYLCAVIDLCGKMVISWRVGNDMTASLVTDTVRDALELEKVTDGLTLHSDQGSQYTSHEYFDLSKEYHFKPSMSSPGCPYDNAAMENFFGTFKTECLYRSDYSTRSDIERLVSEYVHFYNFQRINMKNGLTPFEIRSKTA